MNLERLMNMVLRRLVNRGVVAGMKAVSQRGRKRPEDMTEEERAQERLAEKQGRDGLRQVRNVNRIARRFGRF